MADDPLNDSKPGAGFGIQPRNNLTSTETPEFGERKDRRIRDRIRESLQNFLGLSPSGTSSDRSVVEQVDNCSTPSRSAGNMAQEQAPAKAPLRPLNLNEAAGFGGGTATQDGEKPRTSTSPDPSGSPSSEYKHPLVKARAPSRNTSMEAQYASLFIQPKNRPEFHRPHRINGPLAPSAKDKKPAPAQMFGSVAGPIGSASNPISISDSAAGSRYTQPGVFANYVDPKKAAADLKALIEGSIEDEDDEATKQGDGEDRSQIEGLKVRLLPHQVEGVEWMKGRELGPVKKGKVPKGGILADDMGLGKTLQSISLILSNPKPDDSTKHPGVEKTTLVVAPLALIRQWEAELKEKIIDSHRLKVLVHHGPQRTKRFEDLRRYDVVITTYQILVSEHGNTNETVKAGCFGLHWYRVILDEAHTIKNRNAKATKACYDLRSVYRWCLSGTPMQNNLDELQSLVKFLRISPYDDIKEWKEHIEYPIRSGKGDLAMQRLHGLLRIFMKRRTKDILKQAGALDTGAETKDGSKSKGPSFKVTERKVVTVQAEFSPAEKRFYDRLQQRTDQSLEAMMKNNGRVNYANALVLLLRLRQVCNHPQLVKGKIDKDKDALSIDTKPKKSDTDLDDLTLMMGSLGVEAKHCDICGWELTGENRVENKETCKTCLDDLEYFNRHEGADIKPPKEKRKRADKKGKGKIKTVKEEPQKAEVARTRKARNRRAILDSDDDEDEGSWIVSGDEQGPLRLGKAGGTDDENAEGGGDTIHTEDSADDEDDESQDDSRLNSFIIDDDDGAKHTRQHPIADESDSDDEFESISVIQAKAQEKQSQTHEATKETDDEDEDDTGGSASELSSSESDDEDHELGYQRRKKASKEKTPQVLASGKIRQLLSILDKEVETHKFIVFSQFTSMLGLLQPFLRKAGIKFTIYEGSMRNDEREASLHALRNDPHTRVLLCSLRCGALGLNLTAASRVVILEPFWNPFVEEQAIDRVHRLTQTVDVVVYKLTVPQTVEERILELQEKKRLLAEQAIEGGMKKQALKLGVKEMMELFRHTVRPGGRDDYEEEKRREIEVARSMTQFKGARNGAVNGNSIWGRRW